MTINSIAYDINVADIWSYSRYKFLSGELSVKTTRTLLNKLHEIIVKESEPCFTVEMRDEGSDSNKMYYERNEEEYRISLSDLKAQIALEYFFNDTDCYEYNNIILINRDRIDYNYWFSFKLLQFEDQISEINDFLQYTLQEDFKNDKPGFINFLKLTIRQFKDQHLPKKIVETVNDFLISNNRFSYRSNQKSETKTSNLSSYTLVDNLKPKFAKFAIILKELKDQSFVEKQTSIKDFIAIFENKVIPESKRVVWVGTNVELNIFIKALQEARKICALKNDIWLVTIKCFIKKDKSEFTSENLRGANGSKDRKSQLELIVSKF